MIDQALVQAAHRVFQVRHDVPHDEFPIVVRGDLLVRHVVAVDGVDHAFRPHVHHFVLDVTFGPGVMMPITPRGPIAFTYVCLS